MSIEEILEALKAIVAGAEGRDLTDEEAEKYEGLEKDLRTARRSVEIRSRQTAYETPVTDTFSITGRGTVQTGDAYKPTELDRAFEHYLRTGTVNQDIVELRAQGVSPDSEGGFTVSPQFRQKLVEVQKAYGGLAPEVDSFTTERGGDLEFPSLNDTASVGAITAEHAAFASGTDLVFGTVPMKAWKYTSTGGGANLPLRVSVELLQDAEFDIQGLVSRALGTRIARKQAVDWVTGAGTTLPFGIMHAGLTADVVLAAGNPITYQKLLDLETALDPAYEQNAKWVMNKNTWQRIRAVVDTAGRPLIVENAESGMGQRVERSLLGYPVVIDQAAPNSTTLSARFAVLGDLRESYVIRRVANLTVVVNPYSRAINGEVEYVAWERADGNIQNRSAFALLQANAA